MPLSFSLSLTNDNLILEIRNPYKEIKWVLHVLEFPNDAIFFFLQIQMERGTLNLWVLIIKGGEFGIFIS